MQQSEDYYTLGKVVSRKLSKISVDSQVQNGGTELLYDFH